MPKKIMGKFNQVEENMHNFHTELGFNKNPQMDISGLKSTIP